MHIVPGAGLSIEQRKRVTLGVELVAKPTLLFLDEPTSGLDGQSAFNILRFLRRLVDGGQAVLVRHTSITRHIQVLIYSVYYSPTFCGAIRCVRRSSIAGEGWKNDILRRDWQGITQDS